MAKPSGKRPPAAVGKLPEPKPPPNYNNETPKFCLHFAGHGFDVDALSPERQAAFAKTLQKLARSKWIDLLMAPRKGQGFELIRVGQLSQSMPPRFQDEPKVMVFRYDGKLPMAGVRVDDVYHVLFVEPEFNMLYDHGS